MRINRQATKSTKKGNCCYKVPWYLEDKCLVYQLTNLHFSGYLLQQTSYFLQNRIFRVQTEGGISTPREIDAGVSNLYSLKISVILIYAGFDDELLGDDITLLS